MSDTIYRQDAINVLEKLSACEEYGVEVGTDEETYIGKYEAITAISDLPSADKPSVVDLSSVYSTAYKSGYEKGKADRPQEWVDKAISIIDDMQREGIIDYEQAWEFRMRARMKGADNGI